MAMIEMKVQGVAHDEDNHHVVVLREGSGIGAEWSKWALPIAIGAFEAYAISSHLQAIQVPRPMSHDLMSNVLHALDVKVLRVCVVDLRDNVFYAIIHLERDGQRFEVDSRPSDAIALALRMDAPIYVDEDVLSKARVPVEEDEEEEQEVDTLRNLLRGLDEQVTEDEPDE
jgi:bifunctional DNase/RNase